MHSYLQAIGFSNITKEELDQLIYETIRKPDSHEVALDSDGNEFVEMDFEVCEHVGIAIRGVYDTNDNFKVDYYYPYCKGDVLSTNGELDIIKQSDKESYQGFCDEIRLGVNLIFYLQNTIEYLQKEKGKHGYDGERFYRTYMTGLSLEGKILLPIAEPTIKKTNKKTTDRASLMAAAREGDENAIESLTLEDMDTYSMISKRVVKEDIYSIVRTTFMPYGIESDKFSVIGEIKEFHKLTNYVTMEELYVMHLESNDIEFNVCINEKDLLGIPEIGRRFNGNIWMQGTVEF